VEADVIYQIISNTLVRRSPPARVLQVVVPIEKADTLESTSAEIFAQVGMPDYLEIYFFTDEQAVAWSGWIAHATLENGTLRLDTDNDPDTRHALFEALH
jgi:hypothetical protein